MVDVESSSSAPPRANRTNNPYTEPIQVYSKWHPINLLWRTSWMGGSLYFLHRMDAYHTILHSPYISHQWFKVGLGATIGKFAALKSCANASSNAYGCSHTSTTYRFVQPCFRSRRTWKCTPGNYKNRKSATKLYHS